MYAYADANTVLVLSYGQITMNEIELSQKYLVLNVVIQIIL